MAGCTDSNMLGSDQLLSSRHSNLNPIFNKHGVGAVLYSHNILGSIIRYGEGGRLRYTQRNVYPGLGFS